LATEKQGNSMALVCMLEVGLTCVNEKYNGQDKDCHHNDTWLNERRTLGGLIQNCVILSLILHSIMQPKR